ncbi:Ubiquitinyl hydrolase 1 protein [Dioscorea alata]|uniref:Ubiquitinyl hydrolase 1 protein n=1 Tax=Dioscorea alata TaxID=55571 RepID=A0ACB7VDD8_DIOAL|nr:Ubiquitinyl hydrolase 1 protein [Dioscorea alata]
MLPSSSLEVPRFLISGLLLLGGAVFIARLIGSKPCAVCGAPARKKCSQCETVWCCSEACQLKHQEAHHRLKSEQTNPSHGVPSSVLPIFSSVTTAPAYGTRKVLQEKQKILFCYDEFEKLWDKPGLSPRGLWNCGNSCFVNVVLQCLGCTRPLAAYLEGDHRSRCKRTNNKSVLTHFLGFLTLDHCLLCDLQAHFERARESLHPISPTCIVSQLSKIRPYLGNGNQEDAHEFMRIVIEEMQSVCLDEFGGEKALDLSSQGTTLIQHIFGGYLQTQVTCTKCNTISNNYANIFDLEVQIQGVESLEECLDQFTCIEWLDGENMYECTRCNHYVKASIQYSVHQAPNILTIILQRFQAGTFKKLNNTVTFPEDLDLTPFMSGERDGTDLYTLYAVVVHLGNSTAGGHYICFTKDYSGHWYKIDDAMVEMVDVQQVLAQKAYMLLYSRKNVRQRPLIKPMEEGLSEKHPNDFSFSIANVTNHIGLLSCSLAVISSQSSLDIANNALIKDGTELLQNHIPFALVGDPKPSSSKPDSLEDKEKFSSSRLMESQAKAAHCKVQVMDFPEPCCSLDEECCTEESNGSTIVMEKPMSEGSCCSNEIDTEMAKTLVPVEQHPDDLLLKPELAELGSGSSSSAYADEDTPKGSLSNGFKRKSELLYTDGCLGKLARRKRSGNKGKTIVENSGTSIINSVCDCSGGHSST